MSPISRPLRLVSLVASGTAAVIALTGCGEQEDPQNSCDMLSSESSAEIAGSSEDLSTVGSYQPPPRTDLSCIISKRSESVYVEYARFSAFDEDDGTSSLDRVGEELRGWEQRLEDGEDNAFCAELTPLPGRNGYLCRAGDDDRIHGVVGLPDRLVRLTFYEDSQLEDVTPENLLAWAEEIDERIRELDQEAEDA